MPEPPVTSSSEARLLRDTADCPICVENYRARAASLGLDGDQSPTAVAFCHAVRALDPGKTCARPGPPGVGRARRVSLYHHTRETLGPVTTRAEREKLRQAPPRPPTLEHLSESARADLRRARQLLAGAFLWGATSQGFAYWHGVTAALAELIGQ